MRWPAWATALFILAIAATLRLYGAGREPLWLDEGFSWWDASRSFADIWALVPYCDPLPPLYPAALKVWMAVFGESARALRAFSAFAGVAATGIVMLAGREFSPRIGWIAGLVFATLPFHVEYGHEARPYSLLSFGAALAIFGAIRVLRTRTDYRGPSRTEARRGWIALVVGSAILLWANNTSILFLGALAIVAAILVAFDRTTRPLLAPMIAAGVAVLLLWAPYLPTYIEQARGVAGDFWIPKPDAWRVANELRFLVGLHSFDVLAPLSVIWAIGLAALWRSGARRKTILLGGLFVLPVALSVAVSILVKPIFLARSLIAITPAFALVVAAAFDAVERRGLRIALLAVFVAAQLYVARDLWTAVNRKEPWDEVAAEVLDDVRGDAIVLAVPNQIVLPLGHALETAGRVVHMYGVPADYPARGLPARYPSGKCAPAVRPEDRDTVEALTRGHQRVVLVTRYKTTYDPDDLVGKMLVGAGFREVERDLFLPGHMEVREFVPATGG